MVLYSSVKDLNFRCERIYFYTVIRSTFRRESFLLSAVIRSVFCRNVFAFQPQKRCVGATERIAPKRIARR